MLGTLWNTILIKPIFTILMGVYLLFDNLGLAIIILTLLIRGILIPVMLPSMRTMKKQRELAPELAKLKEKYGKDKQVFAQKQLDLFKEHGINPASGCLTQILTIIILIALYGVISKFTHGISAEELNTNILLPSLYLPTDKIVDTKFLYMDLAKPDPYYILAILSGVLQFFVSKMMMPYVEEAEKAAKKTADKTDDIAYNIQEQMVYTMPLMNFIIGLTLPAGMVLYIVTTTVFTLFQTYFMTGLGGLTPWIKKIKK